MLRIRTDDCCLVGLSNVLETISRIRRDDCSGIGAVIARVTQRESTPLVIGSLN